MKKSQPPVEEKSKWEELQKEKEEWKNRYLRALADYQNLEKRVVKERSDFAKYAAEKIILELLEVFDTLKKADGHLKDAGLTLGIKKFWQVLEKNGVKKLEVLGKKFDPNYMACLEVVKGENEDKVVEEVRPGYQLGEKIIRVAQVKVEKKEVDQKAKNLAKEEIAKGDYL